MKLNRIAALAAVVWLLAGAPASPQQSNTSETYRQLNLFGEVLERVRSDYVDDVADRKMIVEVTATILK